MGLDIKTALKIASPFGAGIARTGRTCGAVTGALMSIGLKYGKGEVEDEEAQLRAYRLAGKIIDRFSARFSSIECKELTGFDLSTTDGQKQARDKGVFETLCPWLVSGAVELLEEVLEEEEKSSRS